MLLYRNDAYLNNTRYRKVPRLQRVALLQARPMHTITQTIAPAYISVNINISTTTRSIPRYSVLIILRVCPRHPRAYSLVEFNFPISSHRSLLRISPLSGVPDLHICRLAPTHCSLDLCIYSYSYFVSSSRHQQVHKHYGTSPHIIKLGRSRDNRKIDNAG